MKGQVFNYPEWNCVEEEADLIYVVPEGSGKTREQSHKKTQ